jgi:hypothetical protein
MEDEALGRALKFVQRAAAADTGAIEGLYNTDRGFTFTVAIESLAWEAIAAERGADSRLIKSQVEAYDYVLDFATRQRPIAEAWIRELHTILTQEQKTYRAWTESGFQNLRLEHGRYKSMPNHVFGAEGKWHSYAPVEETAHEMHRFCEELRLAEFQSADPISQASYAHYAFVCVHPFADGNGRVARALASVFTYRAARIPLLILADRKQEYFDVLAIADQGRYRPFIDFTASRIEEGLRMVEESLRAGQAPDPDEAFKRIQALYKTRGGYTHPEVDAAGASLLELLRNELYSQAKKYVVPNQLQVVVSKVGLGYESPTPDYRPPVSRKDNAIQVIAETAPPAHAQNLIKFVVDVPRDSDSEDELLVRPVGQKFPTFKARIRELVPEPETSLSLRIQLYAQAALGLLLDQLARSATQALKGSGY